MNNKVFLLVLSVLVFLSLEVEAGELAQRTRQHDSAVRLKQNQETIQIEEIAKLATRIAVLVVSGGGTIDPAAIELMFQVAKWFFINGPLLLEDEQWVEWLEKNWPTLLAGGCEAIEGHLNEQKEIMIKQHKENLMKMDSVFKSYSRDDFHTHLKEKYGNNSVVDGVFNEKTQYAIMSDYKMYRYPMYREYISKLPEYREFLKGVDVDATQVRLAEKYMPEEASVKSNLRSQKWFYQAVAGADQFELTPKGIKRK